MIITSNFVCLQQITDLFNGETLTLIINSLIIKQQIQRIFGRNVIPFLSPIQIKSIFILLISQSLQNEISEKICQSHKLRKESKKLLEVAKCNVELVIEHGENEAIEF